MRSFFVIPSSFFCFSTLSLGTDKLVLFSLDLSVWFRLAFRLRSGGLSIGGDSDSSLED